jgi:hypothetical protein
VVGCGGELMDRAWSIVDRRPSIVHRRAMKILVAGLCVLAWWPAIVEAQIRRPPPIQVRPRRPPQDRFRLSLDIGLQATERIFESNQTFPLYLETGSFKFEHTIPKPVIFGGGLAVRVHRRLYAGMAISVLNNIGTGTVTAQVPHPLLFNQMRTTPGEVQNITRFEAGEHFQVAWMVPAAYKLEFTVFGGPSLFITEQTYVTELALGLDRETYPFDAFTFAGAGTDTFKGNIIGYNAGVDLTWRFSKNVGAAMLIRYAAGNKQFTPPGGTPFKVEAGGLHAMGGLRIILQQ